MDSIHLKPKMHKDLGLKAKMHHVLGKHLVKANLGLKAKMKMKLNNVLVQDKQTTKPNNATALPIANPKCTSK